MLALIWGLHLFDTQSREKRARTRGINTDNQKQTEKQEQNEYEHEHLVPVGYFLEKLYSRVIDRSVSLLSHGGELNAIITMAIGRCLACKL